MKPITIPYTPEQITYIRKWFELGRCLMSGDEAFRKMVEGMTPSVQSYKSKDRSLESRVKFIMDLITNVKTTMEKQLPDFLLALTCAGLDELEVHFALDLVEARERIAAQN